MPTAARHIPEDELHAYLDQALSRSQCVEIECHLAECLPCQEARDAAAAVRDRITALLAETAPLRSAAPPPFADLVAVHRERAAARRRWIVGARRIGIAAAAVAAVGLGWFGRDAFAPAERDIPAVPAVVAVEPTADRAAAVELAPVDPPVTPPPSASRTLIAAAGPVAVEEGSDISEPVPPPHSRSGADRAARASAAVPMVPEVTMVVTAAAEDGYALEGLWQSIDWRQAVEEASGTLPRIAGLPVNDIQVQRSSGGERPLIVVTQGFPGGEIVRTVEGPMERVEALLEREAARAGGKLRASLPVLTPPDYLADGPGGPRRGLRIFAVMGSLPADSLNSIARGIDLRR